MLKVTKKVENPIPISGGIVLDATESNFGDDSLSDVQVRELLDAMSHGLVEVEYVATVPELDEATDPEDEPDEDKAPPTDPLASLPSPASAPPAPSLEELASVLKSTDEESRNRLESKLLAHAAEIDQDANKFTAG